MTESERTPEQTPALWNDPVVEEVRALRRQLWEESGRDIGSFIQRSRQAAERRRAALQPPKRDAG